MAEVKSIKNLLEMDLFIPNYQRPYKWTNRNIADLLDDTKLTDTFKRVIENGEVTGKRITANKEKFSLDFIECLLRDKGWDAWFELQAGRRASGFTYS